MQTIHLSRIRTGSNPRTFFEPHAMDELVASVRQRGVIQPIVVRPLSEDEFQIIAGERRFRAAQAAFGGDYHMPCVVQDVSDEEAEEIALIENVQRDAMSATEEAVAAQKIVLRNSGDKDEAARALGWTRDKLERRLALLHCSKEVREALDQRLVTLGHAELLATLAQERQVKVLEGVLKHNVSVHDLKSQLGQFAYRLADAIFDTAQCRDCISNSARQKVLFGEHIDQESHCTNPAHFEELTSAVLEAKAAALRDEFPMVRIVRPSDGFVRLKVVADGAGAVGEEQAKACRSCANFGCAVSAIPTQMGAVFEDNCFSMACNTVKQGAYLKAKKAKEAGALPVDKRSGAVPANVRVVPSEAASNTTPRVVIDYRIAQWRQMLGVVVAKDASLALRFLVAFSLTGQGRWIDRSKLASAADKVTGRKLRTITLDDSLAAVDSIGQDGVAKLMPLVPASAAFGMDTSQLEVALAWAGVDEADHWTLNSTFLKLLTKSEIEAVADEIGLKAHLGAAFKKLAGGKKDELIAGLLAAKDFDFKGKVPRVMRYARRAEG